MKYNSNKEKKYNEPFHNDKNLYQVEIKGSAMK
jgi:hypothetical protein